MSKDSSAKYYQKYKNGYKKRLVKVSKIFPEKKKKLSKIIDGNDIKIFLKLKSKGFLCIEKIISEVIILNFFNTIACCINIFFITCKIYVYASKDCGYIFYFMLSSFKYFPTQN